MNSSDDSLELESAETPLVRPRRVKVDDEMDITPMIDITFLLLIYFLVASRPDLQTAVDLPQARHGGAVSSRNAMVITVGESGAQTAPVYLADGKIDSARLTGDVESQNQQIAAEVRKAMADNRPHVILKADRFVPHRDVDRVMKAVSHVEGAQIHLAVLEVEE